MPTGRVTSGRAGTLHLTLPVPELHLEQRAEQSDSSAFSPLAVGVSQPGHIRVICFIVFSVWRFLLFDLNL